MSFGATARHILDAGYGLTGLLLAGEENLSTPRVSGENRQSMSPSCRKPKMPARWPPNCVPPWNAARPSWPPKPAEFYAGEIIRMDGQRVTRLEMLQLIKEHELTHRQQLFMYLRLNGVVPPTTRRRQAKAKA